MSLDQVTHEWLVALERLDDAALLARPSAASWSLGQVYGHLLETTTFIVDQSIPRALEDCSRNADRRLPLKARLVLLFGLPPIRLRTPKGINPQPSEPDDVEQLRRDLESLNARLLETATRVASATCSGRTKHPILGYLSAQQWLRFVEVHWKHHLRQLRRIENALAGR